MRAFICSMAESAAEQTGLVLNKKARVGEAPAPADGIEFGFYGLTPRFSSLQKTPLVLERVFGAGKPRLRRPGEGNGPARGLADEQRLGVRAEHGLPAAGSGLRPGR